MYSYQIMFVDAEGYKEAVQGRGYIIPDIGDIIAHKAASYKVQQRIHNYQTGEIAVVATFTTDMEAY